jgi:hypothetical protein
MRLFFILDWGWVIFANDVSYVSREITFSKKNRPKSPVLLVIGGNKEDRTPDLLTASQTLSQLSYVPMDITFYFTRGSKKRKEKTCGTEDLFDEQSP